MTIMGATARKALVGPVAILGLLIGAAPAGTSVR